MIQNIPWISIVATATVTAEEKQEKKEEEENDDTKNVMD